VIRAKASLFDPNVYVVAETAFDAEREDKRRLVEMAECEMRTLRAEIARLEKDAACFVWCQNNPRRAQALMWNVTSRKQRKAAILEIIEQERLFKEALNDI